MTDTQHTPGPWEIETNARGESCIATSWGSIADVYGLNLIANGRLIAAAPDLLAALQDVLPYVEFPNSQHKAQVAAAKAAIAKATKGE